MERIQIGKEQVKMSLMEDDMVLYLQTPQDSKNRLNKVVGHKKI